MCLFVFFICFLFLKSCNMEGKKQENYFLSIPLVVGNGDVGTKAEEEDDYTGTTSFFVFFPLFLSI